MRTRKLQSQYDYNGLTTGEFGARTGQSAEQVRELIDSGWFKWTEDGMPECLDISAPNAKRPTYRIHVSAVKRYYQQRASGLRKSA